jgi:hypothetical protein
VPAFGYDQQGRGIPPVLPSEDPVQYDSDPECGRTVKDWWKACFSYRRLITAGLGGKRLFGNTTVNGPRWLAANTRMSSWKSHFAER